MFVVFSLVNGGNVEFAVPGVIFNTDQVLSIDEVKQETRKTAALFSGRCTVERN